MIGKQPSRLAAVLAAALGVVAVDKGLRGFEGESGTTAQILLFVLAVLLALAYLVRHYTLHG